MASRKFFSCSANPVHRCCRELKLTVRRGTMTNKYHLSFLSVLLTFSLLVDVSAFNWCSSRKMWDAYNDMIAANCLNCDKYFHCRGNYDAVYRCEGKDQISTATTISDLREWLPGGSSGSGAADSAADQEANRFGRNGGNCTSRYLRSANCAWNPNTRICSW